MGRFNSFGTFVSGNGGPVSYDGIVIAQVGTCAQWKTDNIIVANVQQSDGTFAVAQYDVWDQGRGWVVLDGAGCNALSAGGGKWAGFTAGRGVFGDVTNLHAGLSLVGTDQRGGASSDGTIATVPNYQAGTGLVLNRPDGSAFTVPGATVARNVQVLDRNRAVWDGGAFGVHVGALVAGAQRIRMAGEWVCYYAASRDAIVVHRVDDLQFGRVVTSVGFHHDLSVVGASVRVGYSTGVQERPEESRVIDVATLPVTDLTIDEPTEPVVAIGRPMWLGFFAGSPDAPTAWQTDTPASTLPGNGYLNVADGTFRADDGRVVAKYFQIAGDSADEVDGIEAQARSVFPLPAVCYCDKREWPRMPNLPANSWMCVQAYCRTSETFPQFEAAIGSILGRLRAQHPQQRVALVPQCYTNNTGQTQNLRALVPIFSRLAKSFENVYTTMPFSGTGRKTGLWEHDEVRPLWEEFAAGITGIPGGNVSHPGIFDGVLVNPEEFFMWLVEGRDPKNYVQDLKDVEPSLWRFGFGSQHRSNCPPTSRQFAPTAGCPNASPDLTIPSEKCLGVKQVEACWKLNVDTIENVPGSDPPIPHKWIWRMHGEGSYQPIPASQDPIPLPPWKAQPDPKPVTVLIHGYDPFVHRSDPAGMLVRFEAESARPIISIDIDLEGDEEVSIPVSFLPSPGRDGRYVRALAFKPVRNGVYKLRVTATNDAGEIGKSDGSHAVTVVE
jgi:hypothetical protein